MGVVAISKEPLPGDIKFFISILQLKNGKQNQGMVTDILKDW